MVKIEKNLNTELAWLRDNYYTEYKIAQTYSSVLTMARITLQTEKPEGFSGSWRFSLITLNISDPQEAVHTYAGESVKRERPVNSCFAFWFNISENRQSVQIA